MTYLYGTMCYLYGAMTYQYGTLAYRCGVMIYLSGDTIYLYVAATSNCIPSSTKTWSQVLYKIYCYQLSL